VDVVRYLVETGKAVVEAKEVSGAELKFGAQGVR